MSNKPITMYRGSKIVEAIVNNGEKGKDPQRLASKVPVEHRSWVIVFRADKILRPPNITVAATRADAICMAQEIMGISRNIASASIFSSKREMYYPRNFPWPTLLKAKDLTDTIERNDAGDLVHTDVKAIRELQEIAVLQSKINELQNQGIQSKGRSVASLE